MLLLISAALGINLHISSAYDLHHRLRLTSFSLLFVASVCFQRPLEYVVCLFINTSVGLRCKFTVCFFVGGRVARQMLGV